MGSYQACGNKSTRRKLAAAMLDAPAQRRSLVDDGMSGASAVPANAALGSPNPSTSDTLNPYAPMPTPVPQEHISANISHPLEPPPPAETLPVADAFCPSGFDMLEILVQSISGIYPERSFINYDQMKVATRPDPKIDIGPVDFSCAFCVCDVLLPDMPIVYCSEGFERLTGYTEAEIVGKNCRFLQYPGGRVVPQQPRHDSETLLELKHRIDRQLEAQHSILNFRKNGVSFQNLLTMIPIAWDRPEIRYYVGFQADAKSLAG